MVGDVAHQAITEHLRSRASVRTGEVYLPHPAIRR
jgi:hypothetical protein